MASYPSTNLARYVVLCCVVVWCGVVWCGALSNCSLLIQKAWNHQAKPYERIDVTFCSAKIVEGNKSSKRYTFDLIHLTGKTYTLSADRDSMMAWVSVIQVSHPLLPLLLSLLHPIDKNIF